MNGSCLATRLSSSVSSVWSLSDRPSPVLSTRTFVLTSLLVLVSDDLGSGRDFPSHPPSTRLVFVCMASCLTARLARSDNHFPRLSRDPPTSRS